MRTLTTFLLLTVLLAAFSGASANDTFPSRSCFRCNKRKCFTVFKATRRECRKKEKYVKQRFRCFRMARKEREICIEKGLLVDKCPKPCAQKSPSPLPSSAPSISSTPSATPSVKASISSTPSATPSMSPPESSTPSPTPSITTSPSVTPSVTPSITPTPSNTPSNSPTPSPTPTRPCTCRTRVNGNDIRSVCTSTFTGTPVTGSDAGVIVAGSIRTCVLASEFTVAQLTVESGQDCFNCPTRDALDQCAEAQRQLWVNECF